MLTTMGLLALLIVILFVIVLLSPDSWRLPMVIRGWAIGAVLALILVLVPMFTGNQASKNQVAKTKIETKMVSPKATVVKSYVGKDITKITKLNDMQYVVNLANGSTVVANVDKGNPPTKKLSQGDRPLVVQSKYWTSYTNSFGFQKEKENNNITIYLAD